MLDPYTLFLITVVAVLVAVAATIAVGLWNLRKQARDMPPETQDDFQISAARWAYLGDRRQGE